jgi:hypothetical protein
VNDRLIHAYVGLHAKGRFPGYSIGPYLSEIAKLVEASGAQTLLDYGCGAGLQYTDKRWHEAWGGIMPTLYDPAVEAFSSKPVGQFDGVICTDVLEHVPVDELARVVTDLVLFSRLWCFVSVCCRPAKANKTLPDGRNAHVTIRPPSWWDKLLGDAFKNQAQLRLVFTP